MKQIAHIETNLKGKFAVPRQSGLVNDLKSRVIFEPEYRNPDAFRGLEDFTHIWLIWEFSEAKREDWSPTVRPPRLGGNTRMGVFATRSPFRPNPIGLSSVRLERIEYSEQDGPVLHIAGADLMNGTPIYDIKPYIPYADSHPDATGGFTDSTVFSHLSVEIPDECGKMLTDLERKELAGILAEDPRPAYQRGKSRSYTFAFSQWQVSFRVEGETLRVTEIRT